jgi:hypothetical protein
MEACRDVLDAVHVGGTYATKYSNVFNLLTRTIYVWEPERRGFDEMVTLDLYAELAQVIPGAPGVTTEPQLGGLLVKSVRITDLFDSSTPPPSVELGGLGLIIGLASVPVALTGVAFIRKRKTN